MSIVPVPQVGSKIVIDGHGGWPYTLGESDWSEAPFRLRDDGVARPVAGHAVLVKVTGRSIRYVSRYGYVARARITFVMEDEPDQEVGGWIYPEEVR